MGTPRFPDPAMLVEHGGFVRALARAAVAGDDLVDDVVQETWLAALQAKHAPRTSLRGWLRGVVRRRAADVVRQRAGARRRDQAAARVERQPATVDLAASAEIARRLITAVLALPAPYRDVILQRYYEGLPPRQISARLGVPVETVRTRVKRSLAALREHLDAENAGDRRRWLTGLAPLALHPPRTAAALAAGGLFAMKKAALVTAVLLLCAVAIWQIAVPSHEDTGSPNTPVAPMRQAELEGRGAPAPSMESKSPEDPVEAPAVRGVVGPAIVMGEVRSADGRPVSAAQVALGALQTAVDPRGAFVLQVAAGEEVGPAAVVRAPGYPAQRHALPSPAGQQIDLGVITLRGDARLVLHVVGARGAPVAEARVRWHLPPARHDRHPWFPGRPHVGEWVEAGHTDEAGRLVIEGLPRDTAIAVFIEAPDGRLGCAGPFVLTEAGAEHTAVLESTHPVRFVAPAAVGPERGLRISVDREEKTQNRRWTVVLPFTGQQVTRHLPAGRYEVRVWGHDAPLSTKTHDIEGPTDIPVAADALRTLTLKLRDEAGKPVPHGRAYLYGASPDYASTLHFSFVFNYGRWMYDGTGVVGIAATAGEPVQASLTVIAQGYTSVMRRVSWGADEPNTTLDLVLRPGASLEGELREGARRRLGLVLLSEEASKVRFRLTVDAPLTDETQCDEAGRFVLRGLGTGRYALVDLGNPDRALAQLDLVAGLRTRWEGVSPSARIEVTEPEGNAARPLALLPLEGPENPQRGPLLRGTWQSGSTIFTALPAGSYMVGRALDLEPFLRMEAFTAEYPPIVAAELPPAVRMIDLTEGEVVRLTFEAPPDPTPWTVRVILPASLQKREVLVAAATKSAHPLFPQSVDWKPLSAQGQAKVLFAEKTPGVVLVALPNRGSPTAPYDVVAVRAFERRGDVGPVRVEEPASVVIGVREKGVTGWLRLESESNVAVQHFLHSSSIENLLPGTYRVYLQQLARNPDGKLKLDDKGMPISSLRELTVRLEPGARTTIDLTMSAEDDR